MNIITSVNNKELTVVPGGRLDSTVSGEFEKVLEENLTEDVEKLVIDLKEVDFISSKGLRAVVAAYKKLNGREMEVIGANASVREVFQLSGLMKVIKCAGGDGSR